MDHDTALELAEQMRGRETNEHVPQQEYRLLSALEVRRDGFISDSENYVVVAVHHTSGECDLSGLMLYALTRPQPIDQEKVRTIQLYQYGEHKPECAYFDGPLGRQGKDESSTCSCGWYELRQTIKGLL